MKKLLLLAALVAAAWALRGWLQRHASSAKIQDSAPVRYAGSLRTDVQKAEEVRDKANEILLKTSQDVRKNIQEAEER